MARLQLIIAGLPDVAEWADLSPALTALFRRGTNLPPPATVAPSQALARLFFANTSAMPALGPIRLAHETARPDSDASRWLCADPVHLRLMRDHVVLGDAHVFTIDHDEAQDLISGLNAHFAGRIAFFAAAPDRWYARLDATTFTELRAHPAMPLDTVLARPVEAGFARGRIAALHNEIQMYLHAHPVNLAREARGAEPINGVWLWGAGDASAGPRSPHAAFAGDGFLAEALARAAGVPCLPMAEVAARLRAGDDLSLCLNGLHAPARYGQAEAWRRLFASMDEQVFRPLHAALRAGRYAETRIEALGESARARHLGRWDIWRFWRR